MACQEVREGRLSIRRVADTYQIPKSTLSDRVSGRVREGSHSGPSRYLADEEEAELVYFLVGSANVGYAKTKKDVLAIVSRVAESKGLTNCPVSHGWWESFRKRHPHLALRTAEKLSYARYVSTDPDIIDKYFDLLKDTLSDNKRLDRPAQIFNCDETGLPLDQTPPYVIAAKGQKHPRTVVAGSKKQITVLACANAAGNALPPLVIFARKALNPQLTHGEVPGTMYGLTDSGWMDGEVFDNWFSHHFLVHAPAVRPLLLLLDGHSTHHNPSFVRKAAQEKVIVFCLPPNTTHITQPLDKGVFGPLKVAWAEQCHRYIQLNPGKVVTQYEFMDLFSRAWCKAMTVSNIMSAFRTTGVYPYNRQAVFLPEKQVFDPKSLASSTGLAYIPPYSPQNKRSRSRACSRESGPLIEETDSDLPVFSEEEEALYRRRLEEGFDLQHDGRYNLWRKTLGEPDSDSPEGAVATHMSHGPPNILLNECHSSLKKFFPPSPPTLSKPPTYSKTSAKVLTSSECIRTMEEKERLKCEKQERKEMLKQERERKREMKQKAREDRIFRGWQESYSKILLLYYALALSQTTAQILSTCLKEDAKPGKEEEGQDLQLIRRSRTRGPSPPSYEE